jgi:hypothetical protein
MASIFILICYLIFTPKGIVCDCRLETTAGKASTAAQVSQPKDRGRIKSKFLSTF